MLKGCLYEKGLGIRLSGNSSDLTCLHGTVRKIIAVLVDYQLQDTHASHLLVDFLEKIEGAYLGKDHMEKGLVYGRESTYYGFSCSWTELLLINSLLRSLADYAMTDELDEINMQLLEYLTRKLVGTLDEEDSAGIFTYIGKRFTCINIKRFIAGFRYDRRLVRAEVDRYSLKKVQQYLSPFFEENLI